MSRRQEIEQCDAEKNKFLARCLIDIIVSLDSDTLKWVNLLVIIQGSSLTAVWLILKDNIDVFSPTVPYKEIFVAILALFVALMTRLIGKIIISILDYQGFYIMKFANLKGYGGKIWDTSLVEQIELNRSNKIIGQGSNAKILKIIVLIFIVVWVLVGVTSFALILSSIYPSI